MSMSLLRKCPLLAAMPAGQLRKILKFARFLDFPAQAPIFDKRDMAEHMFIVQFGRIKIFTSSRMKKRKTFAYLGPGSFFGEMALLDSQERSASAIAVENSRLLVIHRKDFRRFLLSDPKLCFLMLKTLSQRLRRANEQAENLLFENILARVTKTLLGLAKQGGKQFRGGLLLEEPYTTQELADLVGTTREPLSRAMAILRRAQLIRSHHGAIHICSPERLKNVVGIGASSGEN